MRNKGETFPWKIIYQNIRKIVTKNSKEKVKFIEEYTKQEKILIMNFTETWMDETTKKDLLIDGYNLYRGDRKGRKGGGTAIYIREEYETRKIYEMSVNRVEMVAVLIEKLNILNIAIYRPPNTISCNFSVILKGLRVILEDIVAPEHTIIITGDFNFPFVKWKRLRNGGCIWEEKLGVGAKIDERNQFEKLNEVMDNYGLIQIIEESTRKENTLDLVYTNEVSMITDVDVIKSNMSDHDRIELTTNIKIEKDIKKPNKILNDENDLRNRNFNKDNTDWEKINEELKTKQWVEKFTR